jgi:hypothetical protein
MSRAMGPHLCRMCMQARVECGVAKELAPQLHIKGWPGAWARARAHTRLLDIGNTSQTSATPS